MAIQSYQEAMFWVTQLELAKKGNKEVKEALEAEDRIRQENGEPTVKEELSELLRKAQTP